MADEDLRSLERAARERPDDRAAGRAFARALARYGESHRELVEWLRLARLGDPEAGDTIRWWGGRYGNLSRHSLPEKLSVRSRPLADPGVVGIAGATRSRVVVESLEGVHLLDPGSLEEVVAIAAPGEEWLVHAATCGDDVIIARGGWIARHDERGRQLERMNLGGRIRRPDVLDGRIVVVAEHDDSASLAPSRLCILDAATGLGRVLDKEFPALEFHHLIGEVLVHSIHEGDGITSNVLDPVTGAAKGTFHGSVVDAQRGRFLVNGSEERTLSEHDGPGRGPAWEARGPAPDWDIAFGHDIFFATDTLALAPWMPKKEAPGPLGIRSHKPDPSRTRLVAHDRSDGREVWSRNSPELTTCFVAGESVVTVAYLPHLVVEVLALASGKEIARFDLPRFAPDREGVWAGGAVSVPGGLVLVASEGRKPHAIRIG